MIDLVKLTLLAGDGGNGRVSLHREKYVPKGGPDGGYGGDGGDLILQGDKNLNTLKNYAGVKEFKTLAGQVGGKNKCHGHRGDDLVLKVPLGTIVWLLAENETSQYRRKKYQKPDVSFDLDGGEVLGEAEFKSSILKIPVADSSASDFRLDVILNRKEASFEKYYLTESGDRPNPNRQDDLVTIDLLSEVSEKKVFSELDKILDDESEVNSHEAIKLYEIRDDGEQVVLCQGGFGGRGNDTFKSSIHQTPLEAEYGTLGEKKLVVLELRLLADVGLVGFPNAGKSTLLSRLTKARPKIANYPFTTIEPNLGVLIDKSGQRELIIADIPGLIEGASEGKGLGDRFLRHIHNCQTLMYVLFLNEHDVFDEGITDEEKAEMMGKQFDQLQQELKAHHPELLKKKFIITLNKSDLYSEKLVLAVKYFFAQQKQEVVVFSGVTGKGLAEVRSKLFALVS